MKEKPKKRELSTKDIRQIGTCTATELKRVVSLFVFEDRRHHQISFDAIIEKKDKIKSLVDRLLI